ncbi:hypothetical protein Tco_0354591 [Tanacetum coccineum]
MVVEGEVLNDFPIFISALYVEFATGNTVYLALKMKGDMIIKNLNLKPTIDAMMRDFLEISLQSFAALLDGKIRARKRVVRSSRVVMDHAGRRLSQFLA